MQLDNARILITGGASGIGRECVELFEQAGASIAMLDRDEAALAALPATTREALAGRAYHCDVGDEAAVEAAIARVFDELEGIDVVLNNAAILRDQTLVSKLGKRIKMHSVDDWLETLSSNLTGSFLVARAVASRWLASKQAGLIINTSSVVRAGNPGQSAYSATKAAIDALTVTWSQELSRYRIRVAAIAYGFAETGMTKNIPPLFLEQIRSNSAVRRFATVSELADGVRFIVENDYFAGRTLELDGGLRF